MTTEFLKVEQGGRRRCGNREKKWSERCKVMVLQMEEGRQHAKECGQPPKAGRGKERDSPLELPERNPSLLILVR